MNPLNTELFKLYEKLNLLHFLIHFLDKRMETSIDKVNQQIEKTKGDDWILPFHGTSLVITDLTGPTDNGWLLFGRTGHVKVQGEEFIEKLKWIAQREGALAIANAYEAFETYLYDMAAAYGFKINASRLHNTLKLSQSVTELTSLEKWKEAVRYKYRRGKNKILINKLRKLGDGLELAEDKTTNNRSLNMISWFKVVEQVRHAVTHSDFVIEQAVLSSFQPEEKSILSQQFPGIETNTGYLIEMDKRSSALEIKLFAEYAHAIYKSLSIQSDLEWINHIEKMKDG